MPELSEGYRVTFLTVLLFTVIEALCWLTSSSFSIVFGMDMYLPGPVMWLIVAANGLDFDIDRTAVLVMIVFYLSNLIGYVIGYKAGEIEGRKKHYLLNYTDDTDLPVTHFTGRYDDDGVKHYDNHLDLDDRPEKNQEGSP